MSCDRRCFESNEEMDCSECGGRDDKRRLTDDPSPLSGASTERRLLCKRILKRSYPRLTSTVNFTAITFTAQIVALETTDTSRRVCGWIPSHLSAINVAALLGYNGHAFQRVMRW